MKYAILAAKLLAVLAFWATASGVAYAAFQFHPSTIPLVLVGMFLVGSVLERHHAATEYRREITALNSAIEALSGELEEERREYRRLSYSYSEMYSDLLDLQIKESTQPALDTTKGG